MGGASVHPKSQARERAGASDGTDRESRDRASASPLCLLSLVGASGWPGTATKDLRSRVGAGDLLSGVGVCPGVLIIGLDGGECPGTPANERNSLDGQGDEPGTNLIPRLRIGDWLSLDAEFGSLQSREGSGEWLGAMLRAWIGDCPRPASTERGSRGGPRLGDCPRPASTASGSRGGSGKFTPASVGVDE